MMEFSCSFHKGNEIAGHRSCLKWFEWGFGKIIKYTYIGLPTHPTIWRWWSHWVVMTAHQCYLWLRLWFDILCVIVISYDYTRFHVSFICYCGYFKFFFKDMWLTVLFNSSSIFFLHLGVGSFHFLFVNLFWYLKSS